MGDEGCSPEYLENISPLAMPLGTSHKRRIKSLDSQDQRHMNTNWDEVVCPICLDFPFFCLVRKYHMESCLGYVIEYGDDSGDEYEDFPGDEGNWWTSCILYQVFDNFSASRNRRRSRSRELRRDQQGSSYNASNVDEGSTSSLDFGEHQFDDTDNEFIAMGSSCGNSASSSRSSSRSPEYLENISPLAMRLGTSHKFDEGSTSSLDFGEHQFDDTDNEFIAMGSSGGNSASSSRSSSRSYRRRLSGFHDPQKRFLWRQL